jgi:hypothetical protein
MVVKTPSSRKKTGDSTAALLARIAELEDRIGRLEAARNAAILDLVAPATLLTASAPPPVATPVAPPVSHEDVSEEILLVISATVAAFLGERAHVRQVRLLSSEAWAQQGRVSVMASHRWAVHR